VVAAVPHGHWKATTRLAALDWRGLRCAMVLDGAVNRLAFEAFVAHVLAPALWPADWEVMDNLSSHKGPQVGKLIAATGAELVSLRPYSPDLNPVELPFSKIKQGLRSPAARTVTDLWHGVQPTLDRVTPTDAAGYFRHCGYATGIIRLCSRRGIADCRPPACDTTRCGLTSRGRSLVSA
jgi:transposase